MAADPYKSRLFNLLNRRSLRLKDSLGRVSRRAQNTIALAVQIVLYPLYLLVQSARTAANQLGNRIQQQFLPTAANPTGEIEQFLTSLADQETPFIGIATNLEDQSLVFVTTDLQTVAIADNHQQKQINKQITTALANYAVAKRKIKQLNRQYPPLLPNFVNNSQNVLPPIRWFWQLLRWEQQGQVAIAIDLFQESHLVATSPQLPLENLLLNPQPILEVIDAKLANFEAKFLVLSPEVPRNLIPNPVNSGELVSDTGTLDKNNSYLWRIYWFIYAAIEHFWHQETANLEYSLDAPALAGSSDLTVRNNLLQAFRQRLQDWLEKQTQEDPFTIGKLIQAAIDHFFAATPSPLLATDSDQPWLEVDDIFAISPQPEEKPILNPGATVPTSLGNSTKRKFSQESKPKSLQKITRATGKIIRPESLSETKLNPDHAREIIAPIKNNPEEWLETEATPAGYVKHPLERILEVLDAIILWVEELVIKIWRWLRSDRRKSKSRQRKR
jgi:hypothetical protein